jgi:hypothetical protein
MIKPRRRELWLEKAAVLALLVVCAPAFAQDYDNPGLGQKPVEAHPQDFKPLGIRAGAFMLHPGIELAGEWTDNVFYAYENTQSDFIYHLRPYVTAQSTWSRHSLTVRLAADIGRYKDYGFRDYEDYFLNIGGRFDVRARTTLNYKLDYLRLHESLNNRTSEQGIVPTIYTMTGGGLGFDHQFNRLGVGMQYYHADYNFDNSVRPDGTVIDNQDRDRNDDNLMLRLGYQFKTDMQAFVSGTWHQVDYSQKFDRSGYQRSNDGYSLGAGVRFGITGVLTGDISAEYHERSYDDPFLPKASGWGAGASLTWMPTQLTTVRAAISSDIQETTYRYASGYLGKLFAIRVDHELLRDLQINARYSYRDNTYTLTPDAPSEARSRDKYWTAGVGATYFFNRSLYINASYDFSTLESNLPNDGFDTNRVWLVLGLEK